MRILSARVLRARRHRSLNRVEAVIALVTLDAGVQSLVHVAVTAPARAPGAAPLRARLLAAAKLSFAAEPGRWPGRRAA